MGIALVVVGGLIIITAIAVVADVMGKKMKNLNPEAVQRIQDLENRMRGLELALGEKTDRLAELQQEISFVNRLLEDKTKK